jgi:hypothetical protein
MTTAAMVADSRGDWLRRVIRDYMLAGSSTNSMSFQEIPCRLISGRAVEFCSKTWELCFGEA